MSNTKHKTDGEVKVFELFDCTSGNLSDRKERVYERLNERIHIGDDYSSFVAELEKSNIISTYISSHYSAYKLTPPATEPDGTFYVDCFFKEYGCWIGFLPTLYYRLHFDVDQRLTSIEYLGETPRLLRAEGQAPVTKE